jgi:hypothetical protein
MSSYDERSRYRTTPVYLIPDHRGRMVSVVSVPPRPEQPIAGVHLLRQGQRPDQLAAQYLDNPAGFWRIAEANDVMQAEWLTERREIAIPVKAL